MREHIAHGDLLNAAKGAVYSITLMAVFSLITLNCFGAAAPFTRRRLIALANELNQRAAHVVCLQEVQAHAHRRLLVRSCTTYPTNAFVPFIHAPKGGLLTLSRLIIEQSQFTLYRERGRWYTPAVADWVLHKGVLTTQVTIEGVPISVLNTHLNANYSGDWRRQNRYARYEWQQLQQLAEVIAQQPADNLLIVAGDFNIPRGSWLYRDFLTLTGLIDPMAHDKRPTFRPPRGIPARYAVPVDFTLVRPAALPNFRAFARLCFEEKVPVPGGRRQVYVSDHIGIELEVGWRDEH
jgi:endonuclease/exonuclease/phosphatase family metal-dependent hydrolase